MATKRDSWIFCCQQASDVWIKAYQTIYRTFSQYWTGDTVHLSKKKRFVIILNSGRSIHRNQNREMPGKLQKLQRHLLRAILKNKVLTQKNVDGLHYCSLWIPIFQQYGKKLNEVQKGYGKWKNNIFFLPTGHYDVRIFSPKLHLLHFYFHFSHLADQTR